MFWPRSLGVLSRLVSVVLLAAPATAQVMQERVDLTVVQRIRDEGFNRSQIGSLAGYLTDVIGPRLTGSTAMRRANDWTAEQFRRWGLANVSVEPWGRFGRGWERVAFSSRQLEPWIQPLQAMPLAWSGSTRGTVTGPAVYVSIADTADFARYRGKLRGAFILRDTAVVPPPEFTLPPLRWSLDSLLDTTTRGRQARARPERAFERTVYEFLRAEAAAVLVTPSRRPYAMLAPQGGLYSNLARDSSAFQPLPAMQVSREQYNQMFRNLQRGLAVRLEADIQNRWVTEDALAYNTLAEIPGSDLKDQVVMLGAHLDSWFGGTGATDNGAGSVVMMEAMRLLKALGLQPRRTIRIALWSGEEQGLLGSAAWVRNHAGELGRISAYLNVDNGTGRIRGIYNQLNEAVIPIFQQILAPFQDVGVLSVLRRWDAGTDHLSFDRAGVPGFNFTQDAIEYETRTHHTDADTFERLLPDDLKQAATVVAFTAYHLAMRDGMMPRKPAPARAGN